MYVDNVYKGLTPWSGTFPIGNHLVKFTKLNYNDYFATVTVYSGQSSYVSANLTQNTTPSPSPTPTIVPCIDSDGQNWYRKGTVTSNSGTYVDRCFKSFVLTEYLCQANVAVGVGHECDNGCVDGACKENPRNWWDEIFNVFSGFFVGFRS
jgi:hypothetical protein